MKEQIEHYDTTGDFDEDDQSPGIANTGRAIINVEVRLNHERKRFRSLLIFMVSVTLCALIFSIGGSLIIKLYEIDKTSWMYKLPTVGYFSVGIMILAIFFYNLWHALGKTSLEAELETLKGKQRLFYNLPEEKPDETEGSYFKQLVRINVENLGAYYAQVKSQAEKSFIVSIAVGGIGFLFITVALVIGLLGLTTSATLSFISAASGVITEFIAAVFFYLYNKTVRQMKEYHDGLLTVQNVLLSFKLVEDIKTDETKASMIVQMLRYLIGTNSGKPHYKKKQSSLPLNEGENPSNEEGSTD